VSESNPETGAIAITYTYDTDGTCGTSNGRGGPHQRGELTGLICCHEITGGAPFLALFEKWPAGQPAVWDSALTRGGWPARPNGPDATKQSDIYENANSLARCTAFTTALIKVTRSLPSSSSMIPSIVHPAGVVTASFNSAG
jgi:hypothetical protein